MNNTLLGALLPATRTIEPARCYAESDLVLELGWTSAQIRRARAQGLRYRDLGRGQRVYLGRAILDWLEGKGDAGDE